MLSYFLLLAAAATPAELPTADMPHAEKKELQELVAIFTQTEEIAAEIATAQTPTENSPVANATPITITNAIEPSMLEYQHWTGKYSPEKFTISVNGTEVAQGKTIELAAGTKNVEIRYDYSFMSGMRTGGRTIAYELTEHSTQANITFSWKDDWRIVVDNGVAIKEVT